MKSSRSTGTQEPLSGIEKGTTMDLVHQANYQAILFARAADRSRAQHLRALAENAVRPKARPGGKRRRRFIRAA